MLSIDPCIKFEEIPSHKEVSSSDVMGVMSEEVLNKGDAMVKEYYAERLVHTSLGR